MTFPRQLAIALIVAVTVTVLTAAFGPFVSDLIEIINANIVASAAVGLPVLSTASLLIALVALQR